MLFTLGALMPCVHPREGGSSGYVSDLIIVLVVIYLLLSKFTQ